ncbi:MAG: hypothetical protein IT349_04120 [Candidatus Eisenbacteria bacterium]|nr:hypothetical protein [Candidatus Eisenbacteria bacterium]
MEWRGKITAGLSALAVLLALASPAAAVRKVENYPKVALYTLQVGDMTLAQRDTVSWYDAVFFMEGPGNVSQIRLRNPDIELFFQWMPQNIVKWGETASYWYPDTTWSLIRLSEFYAIQNDWYLRDTNGNRIPEWDGYAANWTRYCKKGVYGTSRGLTYVEWLTQVAIPQITKNGSAWEPWGRGSSSYDGLMLEILADCVGSFGWQAYQNADPDLDGVAEGVYHTCTQGGDLDSLSILYREQNELFHQRLYQALPPDCMVLMNGANKHVNPSWWTDTAGMKLESWMGSPNPVWQDWWDWFYGLRDYNGQELWGPGYQWCETFVEHDGSEDEGWDHTLIQVYQRSSWGPDETQRRKRLGLGTTLLGEGYFMFTKDQHAILWQPEYEWDFGAAVGPFFRETYSRLGGVDSLYVRTFADGFVEVNPNPRVVNGVAAQDARFGMWRTVSDLSAQPIDDTSIRVRLTMPGSGIWNVDAVELRYATEPVTQENWSEAEAYPQLLSGPAGVPIEVVIDELTPGTRYHFAGRNRVHGRLEPFTSNPASAQTTGEAPGGGGGGGGGGGADTEAPAAVDDLAFVDRQATRIRLSWTAPGDDGANGQAATYLLRRRTGGAITNETEWAQATAIPSPPVPHSPGTQELFWVSGLSAGTTYGFAVRAVDEAGNVAPLSNPLTASTLSSDPPPPPPDTTPPATIADLAVAAAGTDWVDLTWTATGDDGLTGRSSSFRIRARLNGAIETEGEWNGALVAPNPPPTPGPAGQSHTFRFTGLAPDQLYGFAVRALDDGSNISGIPPALTGRTSPLAPPPDLAPPGQIADLAVIGAGPNWIQLRWTAPGDDENEGQATSYELRGQVGRGISTETQWSTAFTPPDPVPVPSPAGTVQTFRWNGLIAGETYGFALRARDDAGNLGRLSPPLTGETPLANLMPSRTTDLRSAGIDTSSVLLLWTAPHNGEGGTVVSYELAVLRDDLIDGDLKWLLSARQPGPAPPRSPGQSEQFRIAGLSPSTNYSLALRSRDAEGKNSSLSNHVEIRTADRPVIEAPNRPDPIVDLTAALTDEATARLRWSAPRHVRSDRRVAHYELHRRREPVLGGSVQGLAVSEEDSARVGGLAPGAAGAAESLLVLGLAPASTYTFRLTAVDDAGNRSARGSSFSVQTGAAPPPPDRTGPSTIDDLSATAETARRGRLRWTAVGDDGTDGVAARYVVGVRVALPLETESDWALADTMRFLAPDPAPSGSGMDLLLSGLSPETQYSVSVRAWDEAGNLSPLPTRAASLLTPALPDTIPPDAAPLALVAASETSLTVGWSAPIDPPSGGRAESYVIRWRAGLLENEEDWALAQPVVETPEPGEPGTAESLTITGLVADLQYGIALRAVDLAGNLGPMASLTARTAAPPPPPPVDRAPAAVSGLVVRERAADRARIEFLASGEDSLEGSAARHEVRLLVNQPFERADDWERATLAHLDTAPHAPGSTVSLLLTELDPEQTYGVAVRAFDAAGQSSPFVPGTVIPAYEAPPPPPLPDVPVLDDLTIDTVTPRSARLVFHHPVVPDGGPALARYEIAVATESFDLAEFALLPKHAEPPAPGVAGAEASVVLGELAPVTTYFVAVRVVDQLDRTSRLSALVRFETREEEDLAPPDPPGTVLAALEADGAVQLSWDPSADPRVIGYHVYGAGAIGPFERLNDTPLAGTTFLVGASLARNLVRFTATAVLGNGEESGRAPETLLRNLPFALEGPFPHPVTDRCRFRLTASRASERVQVTLFDLHGRRVARLHDAVPLPGAQFDLTWDRRLEGGDRAAPGFYYLEVRSGGAKELRTIYLAP